MISLLPIIGCPGKFPGNPVIRHPPLLDRRFPGKYMAKFYASEEYTVLKKGQSHEKVDELRVWGVSLGPISEQLWFFFNFSIGPLIPVNC
jgi:hypothetical protein